MKAEHTGAVWVVRFSVCGRLMATAGQVLKKTDL